jgi:hypothetical protein
MLLANCNFQLLQAATRDGGRLAEFLALSPWSVSNGRVLVVPNDSRYHGA